MRLILCSTFAAALALTACSNNDNPISPPIGQLRVANAISDSANVQSSVESVSANDTLTFGQATGEHDLPDGNYLVHLTANAASPASSHTYNVDNVNIDKNHVTTVFAIGKMSDASEDSFVVEAPDNDIHSDQSEVQLVNVATGTQTITGGVDFYVTPAGASLVGVTPTNLAYKANSGQTISAPGSYEIRVTPHGVVATILYDSGPIDFPAATTDQFVLIDKVGGTGSDYSLLVIVGSAGSHVVNNLGS